MHAYPRAFPAVLWLVVATLFATGLVLVPGALELRLDWDAGWRLPPGMRLGLAAAHALLAFVTLVLVGALTPLHVRIGWRRGQNRTTGSVLLGGVAVLALSGLGIYYLGGEISGAIASAVHWALGVTIAAPLTLHALAGRRIARGWRHRRHGAS